jgi:hypothetical protein
MPNLGAPTKLTAELTKVICDLVEGGVFPHIAAQASSISRRTYFNWMAEGEENEEGPHGEFARRVNIAKALARSKAELKVFEGDPTAWLLRGPGRHRGEQDPGWTYQSESKVELPGEVPPITIVQIKHWLLELDRETQQKQLEHRDDIGENNVL